MQRKSLLNSLVFEQITKRHICASKVDLKAVAHGRQVREGNYGATMERVLLQVNDGLQKLN